LNWGERPLPDPPKLFNHTYEQFFKLVEFVHDAELTLDITLKNWSKTPLIMSHVGIELLYVTDVMYAYGVPTAAKVAVSDYYELEIPDIRAELAGDRWEIPETRLERDSILELPDPIYFEVDAPYRFSLRLKQYQRHVPNHALIRLLAKSDRGDSKSHLIRTFTW
jgi:hypothetical protein